MLQVCGYKHTYMFECCCYCLLTLNILWCHILQEFYVVLAVETTHIMRASPVRLVYLHLFMKPIVQNQTMCNR